MSCRTVALNGTPQVDKSFNAGSSLAGIAGPTRLCFARGTGLVAAGRGGVAELLNGGTG